jgi:hypothetical protein
MFGKQLRCGLLFFPDIGKQSTHPGLSATPPKEGIPGSLLHNHFRGRVAGTAGWVSYCRLQNLIGIYFSVSKTNPFDEVFLSIRLSVIQRPVIPA